MQLLGLTGFKGAGKDTAFGLIRDWAESRGLRAVRRAFADKLKWSAYRCFYPECTFEDALQWAQQDKNAHRRVEFTSASASAKSISVREWLQHYGVEAHREVFGDDFWLDQLLPAVALPDYPSPSNYWRDNFIERDETGWPLDTHIAVVTDVRFENEATRIKDLGGQVWSIHRSFDVEEDFHTSEVPLSHTFIDRIIPNNGTVEDLREVIYAIFEEELVVGK